jgi:hypothetical protein
MRHPINEKPRLKALSGLFRALTASHMAEQLRHQEEPPGIKRRTLTKKFRSLQWRELHLFREVIGGRKVTVAIHEDTTNNEH